MISQMREVAGCEWPKASQSKETAILILGFNRPDLLQEAIKRLKDYGYSNLWISIDGPRPGNARDRAGYGYCVEIANREQGDPLKKHISPANKGCRDGVIEGISWFFENNKEGIIMEDDVEVGSGYIEIMAGMLKHYRTNKRIWSISSHCDPMDEQVEGEFLRFYQSDLCRVGYGWASWADRWEEHRTWLERNSKVGRVRTFMRLPRGVRTKDFCLKVYACRKGHMDAWDYEWNLSHLRNRSRSITPLAICGINHGFRKDGTHTHSCPPPWTTVSRWKQERQYLVYEDLFHVDRDLLYSNCGISTSSRWPVELIRLACYLIYNRVAAPVRKARWRLKRG